MRTFVILTWCVRSHAWPCIFEFRVNNKIFETWFDENATWSELNRTAGDVLVGMREHLEHKGHTHLYGCESSACVTGRLRDAMVAQQRSGCAAGDIAMPVQSSSAQCLSPACGKSTLSASSESRGADPGKGSRSESWPRGSFCSRAMRSDHRPNCAERV